MCGLSAWEAGAEWNNGPFPGARFLTAISKTVMVVFIAAMSPFNAQRMTLQS
uniref:Uncharacterized protein n=1 Tax=uncultured bacterium contig00013 TaxID=1181504 RepID=A0A806KF82_9BACT|nr:hypothetical protein [uncultured bacterium contig00013]